MFKALFGRKRDRDMPASNHVRFVRWKLKQHFLKTHPDAVFPLDIYHPGD